MQYAVRPELDAAALAGAVGPTTYQRGAERMRHGGVVRLRWDESQGSLHGAVRGSAGELYTTTVYFAPADGAPLRFEQGICTCPVAVDCKHAVALALRAAQDLAAAAGPARRARSWEQSLEALLEPAGGAAGGAPGSTPLAIELTLSGGSAHSRAHGTAAGGPMVSLAARLVRPGRNGGWVGGSLGWTKLGPHLTGEHPAAQVRVLQELYAAYGARSGPRAYRSYSYAEDRSIDLTGFESRQLWPLLDEAQAAGLRLVYGHKLGPVPAYREAEMCLDATRGPAGSLALAPVVRVDGEDGVAAPVLFIGSQAHGVAYLPAGSPRSGDPGGWRFGLARLTRTVPPQLQQLALAGRALEIPAAEQARFRDEFYPRLRQAATVISSDGSFTPPEISGPTLVLRADYGADHDVEVAWEWAYRVGETVHRTTAESAEAPGGYRDAEAETPLLSQLDLPLDRFGLRRDDPLTAGRRGTDPGPRCPPLASGIDTMRFTTELLPLLADAARRHGRGHRGARRLPGGRRLAADRAVHRRGGGRAGLVRPRAWSSHRGGPRDPVRGRVRGPQPRRVAPAAARRRLLLPGQAGAAPRCAALIERGPGRCRTGPAARCGSAGSRPGCGTSWPRSAWSATRPARGSEQVAGPAASCAPSRREPPPADAAGRCCGPTSWTGSAGWRSCGSTGSAASWPTTWGWARRCRPWR